MRAMLAAAPMPIWIRDARGRLAWVNGAYAAAVEANDPAAPSPAASSSSTARAAQLIQIGARRRPDIREAPAGDRRRRRGASSTSPTSPRRAAAPASPST